MLTISKLFQLWQYQVNRSGKWVDDVECLTKHLSSRLKYVFVHNSEWVDDVECKKSDECHQHLLSQLNYVFLNKCAWDDDLECLTKVSTIYAVG